LIDGPAYAAARTIAFGPFRLLPAQQLLLEGAAPVRLGSRAFEVLTALVERPGEVIDKTELIARVWPDVFIDENTLRVHVAGLRRALGDGQPGRRYVANVPGRGYRFVAPVDFMEAETPPNVAKPAQPKHNLPLMRSRIVGRAGTIDALSKLLPQHQLVTILGAGGIGKTTLAVAVAEALLPEFPDGVCFVDLAPVEDAQFVAGTIGTMLGIAVSPQNLIPRLVEFLRDKRMLILLDNCERIIEAAAALAEQLLAGATGLHILATSREPLRAEGERVHRLLPLDVPQDPMGLTAAEALAYPSVQLFVERAAANLDGFELTDADASAVSAICGKLGGIALAIELAAARTDAFGIQQLELLLNDRFRVLNQGKRTAQPRHRSLAAALDWSYESLPDSERLVLCRIAVFVGSFTLGCAVAVAGDDDVDVVQALGNLVAKSLVSADIAGATVQYRLLDTTRAYARQKLAESGELEAYSRRHAQYQLESFKRAETPWWRQIEAEWNAGYSRKLEDVRAALNWAFAPGGDTSVGMELTAESIPLWLELSLLQECRDGIERALTALAGQARPDERMELRLRGWLGLMAISVVRHLREIGDHWPRTLALAEKLGDITAQVRTRHQWAAYCALVGDHRLGHELSETLCLIAADSGDPDFLMMGQGMAAESLFYLGRHADAANRILPLLRESAPAQPRIFSSFRTIARSTVSMMLWVLGLPDQALASATVTVDEARAAGNALMVSGVLMKTCRVALLAGDFATADQWIETLLDCSAKIGIGSRTALGRCFKGTLLQAHGDLAGVALLKDGLAWLREAGFSFGYAMSLGGLAQGLSTAGRLDEARQAIDEALELADGNEERWCVPELLRIKGELLRSEDCLLEALTEARRQEALSWELRAAMSLARLWRGDDKGAEAHELLSAIYGRFTEGFDTLDLKAAKALVGELSPASGAIARV